MEDDEEEEDSGKKVKVKQVDEEEIQKENKLLIILASIFTGLVILVAAVFLFIPSLINGKDKIIPDVTNMTVKQAIKKIQDEGFEVADTQKEESSSEIKKDHVIKTNPAAGSKRASGTTVTLTISTGDSTVTIENYAGKNYQEIKGMLEVYGINVLIERKEVKEGEEAKDGVVMSQDVEAGTKLRANDSITLYIPDIVVKYPDFKDGSYTVEQVQAFCDEHNVTLKVTYDTNSDYNPGTIFYQSREKGFTVTEGTTLTIKVAKANDGTVDPEKQEVTCDEGLC